MLFLVCLMLASVAVLSAQNVQVSGIVTDAADGQPLPGVSVVVKGARTGASTDANGRYTISVPGDATLVFSFVGLKTQEQAVSGRATINVTLETNAVALEDVVVVAYGTTTRRSFTGSAQAVKSEQISSGSLESIDKALMGKVAGLRSANVTGDPGSPAQITIRGVGSINASTHPLYVIDGVVSLNSSELSTGVYKSFNALASLNPEDIESISVLKDAAASSLYGSRAANGVIIITTKKGKQGKTRFTYSAELGQSSMASNSFELMNTSDLMAYEKAALFGYALNRNFSAFYPDQANYADRASYYEAAWQFADENTPFVIDDPEVNTNWRDVIYRQAFSQDHQFSMSGGSQKTQFYVGLGYNATAGVVMASSFDRYSMRVNLDHKATDWIDFSVKQMISYTDQKGFRDKSDQDVGIASSSPLGILLSMNPSSPEYDSDGKPNMEAALPGTNGASNPHYMLTDEIGQYSSSNSTESFRSMTAGVIGVNFTPWLRFTETLGVDFGLDQMLDRWAPESLDGASTGGLGDRRNIRATKITSSSLLRFDRHFGQHNVSALAGFEVEKYALLSITASADSYSTWKLPELAAGQTRAATSSKLGYAMTSFFGNLNYNYNEKYFAAASLRTDASSRLSKDTRWGTFWSVSGAWNIAKESFLETDWLNDLRIKASCGTNGTLPSGLYSYMPQYSFTAGYGSEPGIYWSVLGNTNLTWERSNAFNIGIDAELFAHFGLTAEYYNKQTKDLIMSVPASYITGFGGYTGNNGEISNTGVEVSLSAINVTAGDFKWNADFNIAFQRAIVKSLPKGEDVLAGHDNQYIYRENESMWSFYLPEWAGVDPADGVGYFYVDKTKNDDRTFLYAQAERNIVGKAIPDVLGGFSNNFAFKGFDLSFLITYTFGASGFDYPGYFMRNDGLRLASFLSAKDVAGNYWTPDNPNATFPLPEYARSRRADQFSTRHIFSTDHIRMKEITLGYSIPKNLLSKAHLDNLRIYFKAVNPFMIWQATKGLDPEIPINGYRTTDTPPLRMLSVGVTVGF
jgi:TonB-linked SusC/RagA family outer membrane protein